MESNEKNLQVGEISWTTEKESRTESHTVGKIDGTIAYRIYGEIISAENWLDAPRDRYQIMNAVIIPKHKGDWRNGIDYTYQTTVDTLEEAKKWCDENRFDGTFENRTKAVRIKNAK